MALFDPGAPTNLEEVLGRQADTQNMSIGNQYAKIRRRAISEAGASGRLNSGVSNYTFGDINSAELGDLANVQSGLAGALGGIPTNDYLSQQEDARNRELALLIARFQKPSALQEAFGAIGGVGQLAATAALFA